MLGYVDKCWPKAPNAKRCNMKHDNKGKNLPNKPPHNSYWVSKSEQVKHSWSHGRCVDLLAAFMYCLPTGTLSKAYSWTNVFWLQYVCRSVGHWP